MDQLLNDQQPGTTSRPASYSYLCHEGTVSAVDAGDSLLGEVTIESRSACAACHARSACTSLDSQEKVLSVRFLEPGFQVGDRVRVMIRESLGWQALALAIVVPLCLLLGTIVLAFFVLHFTDTQAALSGIGLLVPYYLILSLFKKRFSRRFVMYAQKI